MWPGTQIDRIGQNVDYVDGLELTVDTDRQAFMGELVDDVEHAESAAIMPPIADRPPP
jgi:hypothetical protein